MARDEFNWQTMAIEPQRRLVSYQLGIVEVARLMERVGGEWYVRLDMHLSGDKLVLRDCRSYETGKAGVELWAARHEARIRAEIEAKREARLRTQTWRRD